MQRHVGLWERPNETVRAQHNFLPYNKQWGKECRRECYIMLLQLNAFRRLKSCEQCEESCECILSDNFRPIQPLNGRTITASFRKCCYATDSPSWTQ